MFPLRTLSDHQSLAEEFAGWCFAIVAIEDDRGYIASRLDIVSKSKVKSTHLAAETALCYNFVSDLNITK